MNYTIAGDNDCPLIQIRLREDETVRIERGCMAYMSDVRLEGKMNSSKKGDRRDVQRDRQIADQR